MATKYFDLQEMWKKQDNQYVSWRQGLLKAIHTLKHQVAETLEIADWTWTDPRSNAEVPYLTYYDFYDTDEEGPCRPSENHITENGELILGLSLTLEASPTSFPKEAIYAPVCVRYMKGKIEYSFFNIEQNESDKNWISDVSTFSNLLIDRWAERVSHDPHQGFDNKTAIGFINIP